MPEASVSVVTPFFNTEAYLSDCIESVLGQTYTDFEYILVDNKSTDSSHEIAERYARRDGRIRIYENDRFVGQLDNYNGALSRSGPTSKYVKFAQADDVLFPDCLARMVDVFEREPQVGLVSSYYLYGGSLDGAGVPFGVSRVPGRDACRQVLLTRRSLTGSQTTVMYRADLVRQRKPFFTPGRYHADTETAFEILLRHDLGYVHQVLSFSRADNPGILSSVRDFNPLLLHYFMLIERYGPLVLQPQEFARVRSRMRRDYHEYLGRVALRNPGRRFWEYHRGGLGTLGMQLRWQDVASSSAIEVLRTLLNPENTFERVVAKFHRRVGRGRVELRDASHRRAVAGESRLRDSPPVRPRAAASTPASMDRWPADRTSGRG